MESSGLARFLFELASEDRLGILAAIQETPLRHAQVARRLDMTASEATRHLNRLASAHLVAKNARGEYAPTNLTRVLFAGVPFLRFLDANRDFVLNHDVLVLAPEFVERLGALANGSFTTGAYRVLSFHERSLKAARQRIWVMSEQASEHAIPIMREKASKGADVRVIRPRRGHEDAFPFLAGMARNYPLRLVSRTSVFLAVLDEIAGVCFPTLDGNVDMSTMLVLEDAEGCQWAADLFLHFWDEAQERA